LTLEDEFYKQYKRFALMIVKGTIQREGAVINVMASGFMA
jgi:hypothetical protein